MDGGQGIVGCQGKDVIPGKIRPGPLEDIWIDPECAPWPVVFHYRELKNLRPFGLIVLYQSVVAFSQILGHFEKLWDWLRIFIVHEIIVIASCLRFFAVVLRFAVFLQMFEFSPRYY